MVFLGMVGVGDYRDYCFSKSLANKYAPLVSNVVNERGRSFYTFDMPRLHEGADKFVLLRLETKMRALEVDTSALDSSTLEPVARKYEIVSARLNTVECVTKEWIEAWRRLDESLKQVVSVSLTTPADTKRKSLAEAVDKASEVLHVMSKMEVSGDFRKLVSEIEPEALIGRAFQKRVADCWQDQLAKCSKRLGIEPKTPLPKRLYRNTGLELLVKSTSPGNFMSAIRGSYPPETMKQLLIYSETLKENVYVAQIERMSQADFETIRSDAKKQQEQYRQLTDKRVEQWDAVLRRAPAALLAEKLILRGAVVDKVVSRQGGIGLKPADIVIDYESIYDFVMGDVDFARSMQMLANRLKQGRNLRVLRGNQIIELGARAQQR